MEFKVQREGAECLLCGCEIKLKVHECQCNFPICNECTFHWAKSQLEDQLQIEQPLFKCPRPSPANQSLASECPSQPVESVLFKMVIVKQSLDNEPEAAQMRDWILALTELQFKHYLIGGKDVRHCPNEKCDYAGTV